MCPIHTSGANENFAKDQTFVAGRIAQPLQEIEDSQAEDTVARRLGYIFDPDPGLLCERIPKSNRLTAVSRSP